MKYRQFSGYIRLFKAAEKLITANTWGYCLFLVCYQLLNFIENSE